ncbi:MAG: signaling protein, partial [Acidobacteria bacterium]|nr:signaling protein [Acidobacteriota bacterium]
MNVIFISDDPREADFLKHELARQAPAIRIDDCSSTQEALARLAASAACDAILLDALVPLPDAINMVSAIRQGKKPIGIVSLVSTAEKNPPVDLFRAGVDNFVLKRSGFVSLLQDALNQAKDRHQANPAPHARQVRLLFAGDIQVIQKHASGIPNLAIESIPFAPDGMLKLPETGTLQDEVLVMDCTASGANTINAIKDVSLRVPDLPVILLTNPGDEETAIQAMRAGASDCVAKTE